MHEPSTTRHGRRLVRSGVLGIVVAVVVGACGSTAPSGSPASDGLAQPGG